MFSTMRVPRWRWTLGLCLLVAMACASGAVSAQTPTTHRYVFSDLELDLDNDASIANAFALSPSSSSLAHLRSLLLALSKNAAMNQAMDDATDPARPSRFDLARARLGGVAWELFQHGLRRLDDGDPLRYRALARKDVVVVEVPGCAMDRSRQLKRVAENPERSQSDWEAMLDIWTLAVTAVNAHRAIVPVTREQIEGARIAAVTACPIQVVYL
ncbi:MAG: hypothetical protein ACR2GP_02795 [Burkholderiaceae bacterium]